MEETLNQRVKCDTRSRQKECVRVQQRGLKMEVAGRSDWSAGVRTRSIDCLGTTRSRTRTCELAEPPTVW